MNPTIWLLLVVNPSISITIVLLIERSRQTMRPSATHNLKDNN